jgi:predicted kinase
VEAVVFCGIQASGKTTFYRRRFAETHVRLSMDLLRTRRREAILLEACLRAGQRFVIDNTNATRADRERYVAPSLAARFTVACYWFDVPLAIAAARNRSRVYRQRVSSRGLVGTARTLQPPTYDEGFSAIHVVRPGDDEPFDVELLPRPA